MIELRSHMLAGMPQQGETDPIEYYRRPLVGRLFLDRINRGLRLLPERRFARVLEVGYGAGVLQVALAPHVDELYGIDLDADAAVVTDLLRTRGHEVKLTRGSAYALPYPDAHFELVVSFSVFEHLHEYEKALSEVHRVLVPGGLFLLGMPAVNKMMEAAFYAIGWKNINHNHVTTPAEVAHAWPRIGFRELKSSFLDMPPRFPLALRLYYDWLLEKPLFGHTPPLH